MSTLATPWTAAYQAPPSMGFSRQKYWSGVPLPSPLERLLFGMSQRHFLLSPSSCYPSHQGFFCPYPSLWQGSGQWKLWARVRYLADFLAGYEGDPLAHFPQCFFLLSFSSFLGLEPGQNPGCLASGPNEAQALLSHCKNSVRDKVIRGGFVRIHREAHSSGCGP